MHLERTFEDHEALRGDVGASNIRAEIRDMEAALRTSSRDMQVMRSTVQRAQTDLLSRASHLSRAPEPTPLDRVVDDFTQAQEERENKLVPKYAAQAKTLLPHAHAVGSTCAICLVQMAVGVSVVDLPCMHVFHSNCILEWFERSDLCPLCKTQA